jgi:hypothetical protein
MVYITERPAGINNVTGNSVAGGTTTTFDTDLAAVNGAYDGMELEFLDGPCKGQVATILTYLQASGAITLVTADALTTVPGANAFIIWTGADVALGGSVHVDLAIKSRWSKIIYIKIVQLTGGAMDIGFQVWESTAMRTANAARTSLYQQPILRHITQTLVQGGQYGESLADAPMPYVDRDAETEEKTHNLHIRIENYQGGTASDFAVSIKVADMGENV